MSSLTHMLVRENTKEALHDHPIHRKKLTISMLCRTWSFGILKLPKRLCLVDQFKNKMPEIIVH